MFGDDVCNEVTVGRSIADVYALTYSDIHCIDRNDLRDVLMSYPESGVQFSSKLKLTFNLRHQVCCFHQDLTKKMLPQEFVLCSAMLASHCHA